MADYYKTLKCASESIYKEKMSKFLSFAIPVQSADEAKEVLKSYQKKYYDARHVCWAYMIGAAREEFYSNDNGEPSGTAGKPILGQINSFGLTNIIIIVVRYFGGIKLGTSGLIVAYRTAASQAIEAGEIIECHERSSSTFTYDYLQMNDIMKVLKDSPCKITNQQFDNTCSITIEANDDDLPIITEKLQKAGAMFPDNQ